MLVLEGLLALRVVLMVEKGEEQLLDLHMVMKVLQLVWEQEGELHLWV